MLEWFEHLDTVLVCDFITRWPTLKQVKRARRNTLEKFFHEHNMRFAHVLDARLKSIKAATPLTLDAAVVTPYSLQALVLTDQLRVSLQAIHRYEDEIAELTPKHPDYGFFSALPGAGPSLAPRLLVAFGEQRERYASAAALQKYARPERSSKETAFSFHLDLGQFGATAKNDPFGRREGAGQSHL